MKTRRITQHRTKHLYALSALLLLGIVGTYAYTFGKISDGDSKLSNATTETTKPTLPDNLNQPVDVDGAREIAQAQKPGVAVSRIDSAPVNGVTTYSIHFTDGTKVDVNATDGAIVKEGGPATSSENTDTSTTSPTTPTEPTPTPGDTPTEPTDQPDETPPPENQDPLPPPETNQ